MLRNKSPKELINISRNLVQPLLPHFHKGQSGKVTVIGGNEDYTGAPFFACHSAALVGADLSHVICERHAAPVIKSYSPDLMIHPYLYDLDNPAIKLAQAEIDQLRKTPLKDVITDGALLNSIIDDLVMPKVKGLLARTDIVVVGPGFGRDPLMMKSLVRIIDEIKQMDLPIILDADSLFLISIYPNIISGYKKAIITPNVVEFDRIAKTLGIDSSISEQNVNTLIEETQTMSKKLGVTVIRKGRQEVIAYQDTYLVNDFSGSSRRVGGQGDTLTGSLATFVNWSYNYLDKVWDTKGDISEGDAQVLACYAACSLVRSSAAKAFAKHGRAMQTTNVHECLPTAFAELFESNQKANI
ncbi:uncharacterized protein SPAPADRAFT_143283 [Spathaspora passalidarum NRRL Y-27907]|uniref:ATP-dependent (S)-NAD(P)H-hydrate dehydratase n=1 Tax=Spathaspora passalidarum (strain NRRL Y-27907 / 11-Y1) TaxID=619300 RepID=G3AU57_SPAPN|nr:uncharacterized protein SPAPADRAFT_143283 [Spathaspora passalidarum NRRL Y-27907]EGW30433.1 hypothetical protein SPAPADRAFT_143283 [Spathaspora passalidarum NRRL Y-27907]